MSRESELAWRGWGWEEPTLSQMCTRPSSIIHSFIHSFNKGTLTFKVGNSPVGGSPGSSMVKNLHAGVRDTGLIPDPGGSHMLQRKEAVCHSN